LPPGGGAPIRPECGQRRGAADKAVV
jgi:hypothetical protein